MCWASRTDLLAVIAAGLRVESQLPYFRSWVRKIRRIEIIFTGNADQREQGIASRIGQGRTHPLRPLSLRNRADRPIRGNPLFGGMRQNCAEPNNASRFINRGGLNG